MILDVVRIVLVVSPLRPAVIPDLSEPSATRLGFMGNGVQ